MVIAVLSIATGCDRLPDPGPSILLPFRSTTTPTPEPTTTPSPLPTFTPTPTPTPTPRPTEVLAEAERAMHNGDFGTAAAAYSALMTRPLDDATHAQSQLGLGTAYLRDHEYAQAVAALLRLWVEHPDSEPARDAEFLLGDALIGSGAPLSATQFYSSYLQAGTVITPYVNQALGDAYRAAGVPTQAITAYERAVAEAPYDSFELDVREKLALSQTAVQNYGAAVQQYDVILNVAQEDAHRAQIAHQAAETLLWAGEEEAGYARHLSVVQTYPSQEPAHRSLVQLVDAGRPVDDLLRGTVNYYAGSFGPAVQALYRYITAYPETHSGDAHWYAGLSFAEAGNPDLAINEFELLIDTHPGALRWGEAWLELAEVHASQDQVERAVETYRAFVEAAPNDALAPEALWRAAELLERTGRVDGAATAYARCRTSYPESDLAAPALYRAGLQHHALGRPADAASAWETLAESYPTSAQAPAALLWLGKLSISQQDHEGAADLLRRASEAAPQEYYGLRAAQVAASPHSPLFPASQYEPRGETGSQNEAEIWLMEWPGLDSPESLGHSAAELASDRRLQRGLELWRLGRFQEAKLELEALRRATYSDALSQYQLALQYRDLGLYRSSILAASRVIDLSPVTTTLDAPRFVLELAYPTYYEDLVLDSARRTDLDPLLMFSLIRQESLFESLATSKASARGLMQVFPPTGAEIASELEWPPDYETPDLYRPYVSLRFGTYYLAQQRDRFDGRIEVALAAYNGGPFNAERWVNRAGEDPDLFLEFITLQEAQLYIKRIKEHLVIYRALYGE